MLHNTDGELCDVFRRFLQLLENDQNRPSKAPALLSEMDQGVRDVLQKQAGSYLP